MPVMYKLDYSIYHTNFICLSIVKRIVFPVFFRRDYEIRIHPELIINLTMRDCKRSKENKNRTRGKISQNAISSKIPRMGDY